MANIASLKAIEILDSRGNPTVRSFLTLDTGQVFSSSVPSGASTGSYEAYELRDADPGRYAGKGVLKAVNNINNTIHDALKGHPITKPDEIDNKLLELDGSENKVNLGANALLAISQVVLKAGAADSQLPLWKYINQLYFSDTEQSFPRLMVNIVNGGKHANWQFTIQEFIIMPNATKPSESIRTAATIFHMLGQMLKEQGLSTLVGDEGGFAPALPGNDEVFQILTHAIEKSGFHVQQDIDLGIDAAATEWYKDGKYYFHHQDLSFTPMQLIGYYLHLRDSYHVYSFEDIFAEDDWETFAAFTTKAPGAQVVGDDLYTTNTKRIQKGIDLKATNAILIKPNQIGTIKETVEAIKLARSASMKIIISHRSGETEDPFIADLAYACASDFLKAGSMSRSDRLVKYNRLLEIEQGL